MKPAYQPVGTVVPNAVIPVSPPVVVALGSNAGKLVDVALGGPASYVVLHTAAPRLVTKTPNSLQKAWLSVYTTILNHTESAFWAHVRNSRGRKHTLIVIRITTCAHATCRDFMKLGTRAVAAVVCGIAD